MITRIRVRFCDIQVNWGEGNLQQIQIPENDYPISQEIKLPTTLKDFREQVIEQSKDYLFESDNAKINYITLIANTRFKQYQLKESAKVINKNRTAKPTEFNPIQESNQSTNRLKNWGTKAWKFLNKKII
jgi:hypothetical protein